MTKTLAGVALGIALFLAVTVADTGIAAPRPARPAAVAAQDSETETVLSTFRPRAGREDDLLATMKKNWSTLRRLGLVLAEPHLILRGKDESGKTIFVEVLTWKDHEAADHVPVEVQTVWNQLQSLVEQRGGHRGIEFPEFEIVDSAP